MWGVEFYLLKRKIFSLLYFFPKFLPVFKTLHRLGFGSVQSRKMLWLDECMVWDLCTCLQWGAEVRRLQSGAGRGSLTCPLWLAMSWASESEVFKPQLIQLCGGKRLHKCSDKQVTKTWKGFVNSIMLVWSSESVCLVLSKGQQLPAEPALLSCAVTQHHCPHPAGLCVSISLPASSWDRGAAHSSQPQGCCSHVPSHRVSWGSSATEQCHWTVLHLPPLCTSLGMSWARPHFKVLGKSSCASSWHGTTWGLCFGDVVSQPALHFSREGWEELTTLRLEESARLPFAEVNLPVRWPHCIEPAGLCSRHLDFVAEVFMKQINQMQVLTWAHWELGR